MWGWLVVSGSTTARADTAPAPREPATVSVDALPTVQINGVVWAQQVSSATPSTSAVTSPTPAPRGRRPASTVARRTNLLAYDIRTGQLINSFAPTVNGAGPGPGGLPRRLTAYVAGDFTTINGASRYRIAAFNTNNGTLDTAFAPSVNARARTVVATENTVYVGGSFTVSSGNARNRLAAFQASNGALLNWAPSAAGGGNQVMGMVLNPDRTKLVVAGQFTTLNGGSALGMGALDPTTGATVSWPAANLIKNAGTRAAVNSLTLANGRVYGTGYVFGSEAGIPKGNLEGVFSADAATGDIKWVADCHGDHYSAFASNGAVYGVGHAHHCDNVRGFPQTDPWTFHRGLAFSEEATTTNLHNTIGGYFDFGGQPAPTPLNWYPDLRAARSRARSRPRGT